MLHRDVCLCLELFAEGDVEECSSDEGYGVGDGLGTDQTEFADQCVQDNKQREEKDSLTDDGQGEGV